MNLLANRFINRVLHKTLWATVLPLCLLWSMVQALNQHATASGTTSTSAPAKVAFIMAELPAEWEGHALRPLALSEVEHRFARRFPGTIHRLTDGQQVLVLRQVYQPTRMLHPATDCYKGLGYRIRDEQLQAMAGQALKRCFIAERAGQRLQVCEHIADAQGQTFTDTSAWYWASVAGQSSGPWQAITTARLL